MNNINEEATPPPAGCMCFQIFDLPHFQLALNQQSRSLKPHHHSSFLKPDPEPSLLKGVEAPRNSLELDEPVTERKSVSSSLSSSATMKVDEQNLNIPVCIPIRTSCDSRSPRVSTSGSRTRTDHDISSECSSSSPAGTKTPTLVARLMGLDLLPENNNSPRISTSTNCNNNQMTHHPSGSKNRRRFSSFESSDTNYITTGTLSLPETPRISLARRSDVEQQQHHHHRLSLQINKENMGDAFEFSDSSSTSSVGRKMSRYNRRNIYEQENENQTRSPGYYARQIVKQVKESVSRKVDHDITNTIRRKDDQLTAKYDQVVLLKPKKSHENDDDDFRPSKQTTPSCSPRFRFLEPKNSTSTSTKHHSPRFSPLSPLPECSTLLPAKIVTKPKPQEKQLVHQKTIQKRRGQKFAAKKPLQACDAIRSKKEELFVRPAAVTSKSNFADKKSKLKTPLSNQLVKTSTVPTILPSRKDPSPSPTKLHIKQESDTYPWKSKSRELSSSLSQWYKPSPLEEMNRDKCNGAISVDFHSQYIQRILKRTGFDKSTPVSLAKWYSPSQPLDPAIFHYLELFNFTPHNSTPRCNRKLIFQLVDQLLVEILTKKHGLMDGEELMETLCARIRSFPSANCQVLEDIDELIDKDMQKWGFDEEVESIVCEMERDIMEEVVHDAVKLKKK